MRKIAVVLVMCTLLFGGTAFAGLTKDILMNIEKETCREEMELMQAFSFSDIELNEKGKYVSVYAGECKNLGQTSYPILPYKAKVMTFPFGTKIESIEIKVGDVKIIKLDKKIHPASPPISLSMKNAKIEAKEGRIYESNEPYPSDWITYNIGVGIENGKHVIFLSIHAFPCRYIPAKNELLYTNEMEIKVKYEPPGKPLMQNDVYDLIIIAPSEFSDALQPLVNHKENHGIKTKLVTLNEIYGSVYFPSQGRDDAEKIKYFIKDAIETWGIKYVLLVGGRHGGVMQEKWWCPVRYAHAEDGTDEKRFLSDLYFADIYKYEDGNPVFDDWDSNGNGIFAEFSTLRKDKIDLIPDVYVGRLPCRNKFEVGIMVDKIIEYESIYAKNQGWFKRMVVVGGDSWPGNPNDPYYEGEEENKAAINYMEGFEPVKIWTSIGTLTGAESIINAVNQGCGFLFFDGHGNPMSWATHPPYDEDTWIGIDVTQFPQFSNKGMYPVCLVGGCHNSQFNVSVLNLLKIRHIYDVYYHSEWSPECYSWWMARKIDGGSIATMGYTGYDWFAVGDDANDGIPDCIQYLSGFLHVHFFEEYGVNGVDILGIVHTNTLIKYITELDPYKDAYDAKTVEEWVLLGDPSLMIGGYAS